MLLQILVLRLLKRLIALRSLPGFGRLLLRSSPVSRAQTNFKAVRIIRMMFDCCISILKYCPKIFWWFNSIFVSLKSWYNIVLPAYYPQFDLCNFYVIACKDWSIFFLSSAELSCALDRSWGTTCSWRTLLCHMLGYPWTSKYFLTFLLK